MGAKKIVIVEDYKLFREGLKALLSAGGDFEIVGEAADGLEAIRCITRRQPDLVLVDLSMPKMNGISVISRIKNRFPQIKIMALTIHDSEEYVLKAFEAGAEGYCLKDAGRKELLFAVISVLEGKRYISPTISQNIMESCLLDMKKMKSEAFHYKITPREREVFKLMAEGYKNKEIANMLFISVKTVEKHRANIMGKLDLHNGRELAAYTMEHGLLTNEG